MNEEGTQATFADSQEAFVNALTYDYNLTNTWKVSPSRRPAPSTHPSFLAAKSAGAGHLALPHPDLPGHLYRF
ncbi:MAG: hypothetical protein R2911_06565 [Caldilineaceae bacterium]